MVQFFISPLNLGNINFGSLGLVVLTKGGDGGTPPTIGTSLVAGTFIASSICCLQSIIFATTAFSQFQCQLTPTRTDQESLCPYHLTFLISHLIVAL